MLAAAHNQLCQPGKDHISWTHSPQSTSKKGNGGIAYSERANFVFPRSSSVSEPTVGPALLLYPWTFKRKYITALCVPGVMAVRGGKTKIQVWWFQLSVVFFYHFRDTERQLLLQIQAPPLQSQALLKADNEKRALWLSLSLPPALLSDKQHGDLTVKHQAAHLLSRGFTDHSTNQQRNRTNKQVPESFCVAMATSLAFPNSQGETLPPKRECN